MTNRNSDFDPSKAEVGVHNYSNAPDGGSAAFPSLDEGYDSEEFEKEAEEEEGEQQKEASKDKDDLKEEIGGIKEPGPPEPEEPQQKEASDKLDLQEELDKIQQEGEGHQKEADASAIGMNMEPGERPQLEELGGSKPAIGPDPSMDRGTALDSLQDAVKDAVTQDNKETQKVNEEQEYMREENREEKEKRERFSATSPVVGKINRHPAERAGSNMQMRKNSASTEIGLVETRDANPIRIKWALDNEYDQEWYQWEPETIWETLRKDGIDEVDPVSKHKILAIKAISNTDEFFRNWRAFEKACVAFSDREANFGHVQEVRLHDVAVTVHLVRNFIKDKEFTDEVKSYIAACAIRDGFMMLPEELGFASLNFSKEIVQRMGDEVLLRQRTISQALDGQIEPEELEEPDQIQFVRMKRVEFHVDSIIEELNT